MLLFKKKRSAPVGARPGTLAESDEAEPTVVRAVRFSGTELVERAVTDVDALPKPGENEKLWLDVRGLGTVALLAKVGASFGVHKLALEDIVNVPQRPKVEVYEHDGRHDHFLFVFRSVAPHEDDEIKLEQISVVLGQRCVLTFQETHDDTLAPIRARLAEPGRPIRKNGADYLAYAVLDAVVDGYYPVLERIAEQLEALEERIIRRPTPRTLRKLQRSKRTLLLLRRSVWPQREALAQLLREPSPLIAAETRVFLRDIHDHCVQIADVVESYRDLVTELTNTYLSVVSNRMNEIMKVLTIMASIFIPLTFMAGIYGMNFDSMPELHLRWAYPALLGAMLLTAGAMLVFFWRRGWIGNRGDEDE